MYHLVLSISQSSKLKCYWFFFTWRFLSNYWELWMKMTPRSNPRARASIIYVLILSIKPLLSYLVTLCEDDLFLMRSYYHSDVTCYCQYNFIAIAVIITWVLSTHDMLCVLKNWTKEVFAVSIIVCMDKDRKCKECSL